MKVTSNFLQHAAADTQYVVSQGGARSGKTYSILQLLIQTALKNPGAGLIITVVRATWGGAKAGPVVDFKKILEANFLWDWKAWNKTEMKYNLKGNTFEFIGADKPDKWRGPQRDFLFINECNNLSWTTAWELISRTSYNVYLDFNPTEEFWVHTNLLGNPRLRKDSTFIKSSVYHNELCPPKIRENILARAAVDPMYKRVFLDGEIGISEGMIFTNWELVRELPGTGSPMIGLDFGFTNDPSTAVLMEIGSDNSLYVDELFHHTGLLNDDIAERLRPHPQILVSADSAEPKSIAEIKRHGIPITGVTKGAGSLMWGINLMLQRKIFVTERSENIIRELRAYKWAEDRDGKPLNVPIDRMNHTIDAIRYGLMKWTENQMTKKHYRIKRAEINYL